MIEFRERPYQEQAIASVEARWSAGTARVLLVAPTGSGKTYLGQRLVAARHTLWVAHTRELVRQAVKCLRAAFGVAAVGYIMPGEPPTTGARIQVGTVQTLLARGISGAFELVVLDEAHHYVAEEWAALAKVAPCALLLGLTATPQRADGEALGDVFEDLVVAANYTELLRDGFLVDARVHQPPEDLGSDLAQDPVEAWAAHSEGSQTFDFEARVDLAYQRAEQFRGLGINAQVIEGNTAARDRKEILAAFDAGKVRVLCSVYALGEGVDVPNARCALLSRNFGFVGGYLQAVGRVLRTAAGKPDAIVIDLCGATIRHKLPTIDREYSLAGRAISGEMPERGEVVEREAFSQEIRGVGLVLAARGAMAVPALPVEVNPIAEAEKRAEFERLRDLARKHRMRDGFAVAKFKEKYGEWPKQEWA